MEKQQHAQYVEGAPGQPVNPQHVQLTTVQPAAQPLLRGPPGPPGVPGAPGASVQWMAPPQPIAGVPPGLEYLAQIDQVLVHQQIELFEVVTNWEMANKYQIKNSLGQQVYFASEESGACMRQCCGNTRGWVMHIVNNYSQEVMRVIREFKCCAGRGSSCCACCGCCQTEVSIEAPIGQVLGYVRQECSVCSPNFVIQNSDGETIFTLSGPCCMIQNICCPTDIEFPISSVDGHVVGKLYKQWGGFVREAYSKADNFGISFPVDLDVKMKAVLLGSVFLIDFVYFEQPKDNKQHHN